MCFPSTRGVSFLFIHYLGYIQFYNLFILLYLEDLAIIIKSIELLSPINREPPPTLYYRSEDFPLTFFLAVTLCPAWEISATASISLG